MSNQNRWRDDSHRYKWKDQWKIRNHESSRRATLRENVSSQRKDIRKGPGYSSNRGRRSRSWERQSHLMNSNEVMERGRTTTVVKGVRRESWNHEDLRFEAKEDTGEDPKDSPVNVTNVYEKKNVFNPCEFQRVMLSKGANRTKKNDLNRNVVLKNRYDYEVERKIKQELNASEKLKDYSNKEFVGLLHNEVKIESSNMEHKECDQSVTLKKEKYDYSVKNRSPEYYNESSDAEDERVVQKKKSEKSATKSKAKKRRNISPDSDQSDKDGEDSSISESSSSSSSSDIDQEYLEEVMANMANWMKKNKRKLSSSEDDYSSSTKKKFKKDRFKDDYSISRKKKLKKERFKDEDHRLKKREKSTCDDSNLSVHDDSFEICKNIKMSDMKGYEHNSDSNLSSNENLCILDSFSNSATAIPLSKRFSRSGSTDRLPHKEFIRKVVEKEFEDDTLNVVVKQCVEESDYTNMETKETVAKKDKNISREYIKDEIPTTYSKFVHLKELLEDNVKIEIVEEYIDESKPISEDVIEIVEEDFEESNPYGADGAFSFVHMKSFAKDFRKIPSKSTSISSTFTDCLPMPLPFGGAVIQVGSANPPNSTPENPSLIQTICLDVRKVSTDECIDIPHIAGQVLVEEEEKVVTIDFDDFKTIDVIGDIEVLKMVDKVPSDDKDKVSVDVIDDLSESVKYEEPSPEVFDHVDLRGDSKFNPITKRMHNVIIAAMLSTSEIVLTSHNMDLTKHDLFTLTGSNWVNDQVIEIVLTMIAHRSLSVKYISAHFPRVHTMSTYFWPNLSTRGYSSVKKWTKEVDIFKFDLVLVPIHMDSHWSLVSIDFRVPGVFYYDSLGNFNNSILTTLMYYLAEEHKDKKGEEINLSKYAKHPLDSPLQQNGSDCGMFCLKTADFLSRNLQLDFGQVDMKFFRMRMIFEIMKGVLLEP